jgi:hypothetical protein
VAQKVVTRLVDDLDGAQADDIETVTFALDGVTYQIDLTAEHAGELRDTLGQFVTAARRAGGRIQRGRASRTPHPAGSQAVRNAGHGSNGAGGARSSAAGASPGAGRPGRAEQSRAIREWAQANGYQVSNQGRIATHIVEAFEAAHARDGAEDVTNGAGAAQAVPTFSG